MSTERTIGELIAAMENGTLVLTAAERAALKILNEWINS
jgi:hypothetical protein